MADEESQLKAGHPPAGNNGMVTLQDFFGKFFFLICAQHDVVTQKKKGMAKVTNQM